MPWFGILILLGTRRLELDRFIIMKRIWPYNTPRAGLLGECWIKSALVCMHMSTDCRQCVLDNVEVSVGPRKFFNNLPSTQNWKVFFVPPLKHAPSKCYRFFL